MKRLGTVLHFSAQKKLILRGEGISISQPALGSAVYTKTKRKVGWVHDVMGHVGSPYVAVRVQRGMRAESLAGQRLYVR
ncbi:MAG: H/ACA ribonucleoprotein complex subunit GAR1 [Methermicoccaceae archaeon]